MPTGDHLMPPDVRKAKHIRYLMTERADIGDAEDAEVVANGAFSKALGDGDDSNGEAPDNGSAPVHIASSFDSFDEMTDRVVTPLSQYDSASRNGSYTPQ